MPDTMDWKTNRKSVDFHENRRKPVFGKPVGQFENFKKIVFFNLKFFEIKNSKKTRVNFKIFWSKQNSKLKSIDL
jgi:hypothetical protein